MGRRVEKTVLNRSGDAWLPESSILFVYNGYKLVEELDGLSDAKPPLRRYTWQPETLGFDVPLSVFDVAAKATYFYTTDANKNVSDLTDSAGNVVAHYEYSPFGVPTLAAGTYAAANSFRFSSEYHDPETNLVYYNYRYYSPALGRWLSRDPIGEIGGINLYGMCHNNPVIQWDKNGLFIPLGTVIGGAFLGAMSGAGIAAKNDESVARGAITGAVGGAISAMVGASAGAGLGTLLTGMGTGGLAGLLSALLQEVLDALLDCPPDNPWDWNNILGSTTAGAIAGILPGAMGGWVNSFKDEAALGVLGTTSEIIAQTIRDNW